MTRVRKWLGYVIDFRLTLGELLGIVAVVLLVNAIWPGLPVWVFFVLGFAAGIWHDVWCRLRRKAADA